jgi:hypothetical protein
MTDKVDEMLEGEQRLIQSKWQLGFRDRGHGHGDFGIVTENGELVAEMEWRQSLAAHIIEVHNKSLE